MDSAQEIVPPLSITELTAGIKQLLEQSFAHIRVFGEISRLTRHASGHLYFTVKDQNASISAVIWRSTAVRLKTLPKEGVEFILGGHLSVYEPRGTYQLIIQSIEEAGSGQLATEFERRKQLFAERGWFDPARKKPLPPLPLHIGIVTSPSTAAIEDVRKVLATRPSWLKLTLSPCLVQGDAAPASIAAALERITRTTSPPDVILLVRGGGSVEDLWCFNDETVIRAIVDSPIPVISGIGHEIDTTLTDFASDARAATPSNAAEIACPAREELRQRLPRLPLLHGLLTKSLSHATGMHTNQVSRMQHAWRLALDTRHLHIERFDTRINSAIRQNLRLRHIAAGQWLRRLEPLEPGIRMRQQRQRLGKLQGMLTQHLAKDIATARHHVQRLRLPISLAASHAATRTRRTLDYAQQRLEPKAGDMLEYRQRLLEERVSHLQRNALTRCSAAADVLHRLQAQMHALDPMDVLRRGFTLATTPDGSILHSISQVKAGSDIALRFHDGTADARIIRTEENP